MEDIDLWLRAWITAFSLCLLFLSIAAYQREREHRLLLVAGLFGIMAVKAVFLTLGIMYEDVELYVQEPWFDRAFDLLIVVAVMFVAWGIPGRRDQ